MYCKRAFMPSGSRRMTRGPMPEAALLDSPLAGAEFLAVDTETNGQPKERCELTEVGAVLVGGGELHDRWSSLVGVSEPLGRGIQRFTGITQAMVDEAPPPERVLPELAEQMEGRILVAHSARFDVGVLKQAFERAELEWPDPPVHVHGGAGAPAGAAAAPPRPGLAGRRARDRGRGDPPRAARRRDLRARAVRAAAAAVRERAHGGGGAGAAAPPQGAAAEAAADHARPRRPARPLGAAQGPGRLHLPRRRRPPAVRRQVDLPAHARAGALHHALDVDRPGRARRLPADRVRARRARAREPADQGAQAARQHAAQEGARRLRLPALPARHPVPDPRGRARAGRRPRDLRRPGARAGGGRRAGRAAQLAVRAAPLRPHAGHAPVPVRVRADGALPARRRGVPRRRHRDQRPRARALRADRGRARCSSAAASCTSAGPRSSASRAPLVARHPALHRDHAGDGRRGAAARGRAARAGRAAARAACSSPTRRASTSACCAQAFARAALDWPDPPVLCTVALARRLRAAAAPARAGRAGRRARDRGRRDPPRAAGRRDLRARASARCSPRLCANARDGRRGAGAARARASAPRPQAAPGRTRGRATSGPTSRRCRRTPASTSSATPTGTRSTSASRSACARARARTSRRPSAWTGAGRARRLRGDRVRARRAGAREPADQGAQAARQHAAQARGRRLRLPALPARHPVPDPRGRARAGRRPRGLRRPGARARRGGRAGRAAQLAVRPAPLRPRAAAPPAPVGLRADGPLPVAVPGRPRPEPLPRAARRRRSACSTVDGGAALLAHVEAQMRAASAGAALRARRLAAPPRARGWSRCSARLGGVLRAAHAGSRLVLAPHPAAPGRADAFWIVAGRIADWGAAAGRPRRARGAHRGRAAPRRRRRGGWLPADELDEARIVGVVAGRPRARRVLELEPRPASRRPRSSTAFAGRRRRPQARVRTPAARAAAPGEHGQRAERLALVRRRRARRRRGPQVVAPRRA